MIQAIRSENGIMYTNIWSKYLICKCRRIAGCEEIVNAMERNRLYSMDELIEISKHFEHTEYAIEAMEYLRDYNN